MNGDIIIVAPHIDDEMIGCFSILCNQEIEPIIIYTSICNEERKQEALLLKKYLPNVKIQMFTKHIPSQFMSPLNSFYFPDPCFETHPEHRRVGMIGEEILRDKICKEVIFYSTNMSAPYIHEISNANYKKNMLNKIYKSQKSLWEYENKYFLFEGYCKWIV